MIKAYYKGVEVSVLKKIIEEHNLPCDYDAAWQSYIRSGKPINLTYDCGPMIKFGDSLKKLRETMQSGKFKFHEDQHEEDYQAS